MDFSDAHTDIVSTVVSEEQIAEGLARMARAIEADLAGKTPLLVGVLKGAVMVMADLARELRIPVEMDWMEQQDQSILLSSKAFRMHSEFSSSEKKFDNAVLNECLNM